MVERYKKPYLDSCVFISWVTNEDSGESRGQKSAHVLKEAEGGQFPIYTSTLTLAEVHKKRNYPIGLSDEQDDHCLLFFEQDFIKLITVDRQIGEHANQLCRKHGLLPADGIHLACALRAGCDVFLTWDDKLLKLNEPGIQIEKPRILGQIKLNI